MGSKELNSEEKSQDKVLEGPPAAKHQPPDEQKHTEEHKQTTKESRRPAWRRAVVPSLYIAGSGIILYAAWKWLRPKTASKEPKPTWTLDNTLGPYK